MAHYNASFETPRLLDEVFAYLSDFSTTRESGDVPSVGDRDDR
jgi:hypothetical protein